MCAGILCYDFTVANVKVTTYQLAGHTFDSYKNNQRAQDWIQDNPGKSLHDNTVHDKVTAILSDKAKQDFNRGNVPVEFMQEVGFEDCDWISIDNQFGFSMWEPIVQDLYPYPVQFHVPC